MSAINGKVVVITGASSGIGEATAQLLASQGAHVVIGARRLERLEALATAIRAEGGSAEYQQLDVTVFDQMEAIIRLAQDRFGRLDVVLNNAGVMPLRYTALPNTPFERSPKVCGKRLGVISA